MRARSKAKLATFTHPAASASLLVLLAMGAARDLRAATFQTVDGEAVIEAEGYTRVGSSRGTDTSGKRWYVDTARKGYKGAGYLQGSTAGPSTLKFHEDNIRVEYDIDFRETGTYYLHLRTWADDHTENGFFATVDGQHVRDQRPFTCFVGSVISTQDWKHFVCSGNA